MGGSIFFLSAPVHAMLYYYKQSDAKDRIIVPTS